MPNKTSPSLDFEKLGRHLKQTKTDKELFQAIVNAPFDYKVEMALFFLGIIVFLLVNPETDTIDRIALSNTNAAKAAKLVSVKRFGDIRIPMRDNRNIIAKAIKENMPQSTHDWKNLFVPELTAGEARLNQASSGVAFSAIYPLKGRKRKGALIFSYYQYPEKIGNEQYRFMKKYAQLVAKQL